MTHWKLTHKKECKIAEDEDGIGVKLERPPPSDMFMGLLNSKTMNATCQPQKEGDGYRKPNQVAVGAKFYVKVQGGGSVMPLLIYDETRQCTFNYCPGLRGFDEIRKKVNAEPAFQGRKTYMKASFDENGNCTVYPSSAKLKNW